MYRSVHGVKVVCWNQAATRKLGGPLVARRLTLGAVYLYRSWPETIGTLVCSTEIRCSGKGTGRSGDNTVRRHTFWGSLDMSMLTPHGECLLWTPELLWVNAVSDVLIALAFF